MQDPHDPVEAIRGLKADFVRGAAKRLASIERDLARLKEAPADRGAFQALRSELKAFASLGKASGFPKVSRIAQEGESRCERVARASPRGPSAEDVDAWSSAAAAIRAELGLEAAAPPAGEPA